MEWALGAIGFGVAGAYWPAISAFAVAPKWAVLALVPLLLVSRRVEMKAAHWAGLALLGYAALSLAWHPVLLDGLDGLAKLLLVAACFMAGSLVADLTILFEAFAWGVTLSAVLAIAQYLGWDGVNQLVPPAGLFGNKNFLGEAAALALIGVVGRPRWWLAIGPLVALWFSGCREAWLAAGVGLLVPLWAMGYRKGVIETLVGLCGAISLLSLGPFGHVGDMHTRLAIWHDTWDGLTWLGRGIGSFMVAYPQFATHMDMLGGSRPEFAHNDGLQLLFELGPIGLAFACGMCAAIFVGGLATRGCAILAALCVETLLGFPLHMPATAFLGACVAGHLARTSTDLRAVLARLRALGARGLGMAGRVASQDGAA